MAASSNMTENDQFLLAELKKGNTRAFAALYDAYWERLYYTCYRRIELQEETEDILQELFADIWNNREKLQIRTSLSVYIFTALKYKIFRFIDAKVVRQKHMQRLGNEEPAAEETIERDLSFDELYSLLEERIEHLPVRCRLVFRMSREQELTVEEIAKQLNISPSTVHNQITKAKKILKNELKRGFVILSL
jgi:RNA polymerase sigma-70 factor (ECF subfamily)